MSSDLEPNVQSEPMALDEHREAGIRAREHIAGVGQAALQMLNYKCALGADCHAVTYVKETRDRATLTFSCENCPNADVLRRVVATAVMQVEPEEWPWHALLVYHSDQKS